METATHQPANEHILLTSLGMQARPTTYQWHKKTADAKLTPLALVQLLDKSQLPTHVVAVLTEGAKARTWPIFKQGIKQVLPNVVPEVVDIPDGSSSDEIREILETVAEKIPKSADLTLDVTQGLRHFPFIFYALVLYLKSLRNVTIRGAYYGMIEGFDRNDSTPRPIIDLQPLLDLPEWFYAVRMFRELGTTSPIADLIQPLAERLAKEKAQLFKDGNKEAGSQRNEQAKQVKSAVDWLEKYAFAYESALPLELGKASRGLSGTIRKLAKMSLDGFPPLAKDLTDAIANAADSTAFAKDPTSRGDWKNSIPLDENELARQAKMIDVYLDRGQLPLAVGLMREWVISWAMLQSGQTKDWLKHDNRLPYERRLGALGAFVRDPAATAGQKAFGTFWNQLGDSLRNALHHHAMREEAIEKAPKPLEEVRTFWGQLKNGGRLLLSPQGTRPGVLFSALKVANPDTCLVICSAASASSIAGAAKHAGFGGAIEQIEMTDPHGGFDEIDAAVAQARRSLLMADEVVANVTGGTTLMGLVVQRLVEEARKLDRPVRRFALIDRRSQDEQDSDPFVQGDCHWLDN